MFEDWFKIRGFLGIFISLIIAIFSFAIFLIPANNHINSSYEKNASPMHRLLVIRFMVHNSIGTINLFQ